MTSWAITTSETATNFVLVLDDVPPELHETLCKIDGAAARANGWDVGNENAAELEARLGMPLMHLRDWVFAADSAISSPPLDGVPLPAPFVHKFGDKYDTPGDSHGELRGRFVQGRNKFAYIEIDTPFPGHPDVKVSAGYLCQLPHAARFSCLLIE